MSRPPATAIEMGARVYLRAFHNPLLATRGTVTEVRTHATMGPQARVVWDNPLKGTAHWTRLSDLVLDEVAAGPPRWPLATCEKCGLRHRLPGELVRAATGEEREGWRAGCALMEDGAGGWAPATCVSPRHGVNHYWLVLDVQEGT